MSYYLFCPHEVWNRCFFILLFSFFICLPPVPPLNSDVCTFRYPIIVSLAKEQQIWHVKMPCLRKYTFFCKIFILLKSFFGLLKHASSLTSLCYHAGHFVWLGEFNIETFISSNAISVHAEANAGMILRKKTTYPSFTISSSLIIRAQQKLYGGCGGALFSTQYLPKES